MILEITLSICMIIACGIYAYLMLELRARSPNWKRKYHQAMKELERERKRKIEVFPHV